MQRPEAGDTPWGVRAMIRKLLLPALAATMLAGCMTDYTYRGGAGGGDYYRGSPSVEYRYYGGYGGFYGGYPYYGYGGYYPYRYRLRLLRLSVLRVSALSGVPLSGRPPSRRAIRTARTGTVRVRRPGQNWNGQGPRPGQGWNGQGPRSGPGLERSGSATGPELGRTEPAEPAASSRRARVGRSRASRVRAPVSRRRRVRAP